MPKFNTKFDLNVDDMELIETALRKTALSEEVDDPRPVNELLGRLHNQKVFFRPAEGIYVSG